MTRCCLVTFILALAACPSQSSVPREEAKPAAPTAVPQLAAAGDKAKTHECIYAQGQKGDDPSCPEGGGEVELAKDGGGHFGAPLTLSNATPLAAAIEGGGESAMLVRGEVEAVCQKKGCWMVLKDGDRSARVLMKDHGFTVPMDCRGKTAIVEGTLASRTFDEGQVKHLEKDAGRDPTKVAGSRTEYVLTATGVKIENS